MKKIFKIIFITIISFSFINSIGAIPSACDGKVVDADSYYYGHGYEARVRICQLANCREDGDTGCQFGDAGTAAKWCEGEYTSGGYKGQYHTVRTGKCDTEKIFKCTSCSATGCPYTCEVPCADPKKTGCTSICYNSFSLDLNKAKLEKLTDGEVESKVKAFLEKYSYCRYASCDPYTYKVVYNTCDCIIKDDYVTQSTLYNAKFSTIGDSGNRIPAYCVSPALANAGSSNVYTVDATQCESSNSTRDCGYANIMIEGEYRNRVLGISSYNYAVIADAMRLWGAYVGQDGYTDTGIADEDGSTIGNENDWLRFVPVSGNTYKNVFKGTVEEIFKNTYFQSIHGGTTKYSLYNVVDPDTGETYNIAEQNRLRLKAATCSRTAMLCGTSSTNYVKALYLFVNTVQGNPHMQDHLNAINQKINGTDDDIIHNDPTNAGVTVQGETIKISYNLRKGVEINCNTLDKDTANDYGCEIKQKITILDKNGNKVNVEIDGYDYCVKNVCYVELTDYSDDVLTCDELEKVTVVTQYYKTCGEESVKKYVSCGSPTTTQLMFSFEPDYNCKEGSSQTKTIEITPICNLCRTGVEHSNPSCSSNETEDYVINSTSDPSLNCILHKSSVGNGENQNDKAYYDYSSLFGVNTNFCRVYCSDKVTYYLAPKQKVNSSLQLKYDIESKVFGSRPNKSSHALTSIVMVKRDCVSNIYYNNIFDFNKDWATAYGVSKDASVNNWQELYNALLKQSAKENNRVDVLNQVIYDLYNCNFFEESKITGKNGINGGIIQRPKDSVNAYSKALDLLKNTEEYCDGIDCVSAKIKYEAGAEYITPKSTDVVRTGQDYLDPVLSTNEIVDSKLQVKYCKEGECFRGIPEDGKYKEDYDGAKAYNQNLHTTTVQFGNKGNVRIPSNDYAVFSYSVEADLHNSTVYQTQEYTGKVQVVDDTNYNSKYLDLSKYVYPVSSYAKKLCTPNANGGVDCDVDYKFRVPLIVDYNKNKNSNSKVIAFYRKFNDDDLIEKLDNHDYTCEFEVVNPCKGGDDCVVGYGYKNIDLNNPFPNERHGTNWDFYDNNDYSKYVLGIVNEIEESGKNHLYATDDYLEYSYRITGDTIEAIRDDNKSNGYFTKPYDCTKDEDKNIFLNCNSDFLDKLHSNDNPFKVEVIKDDGVSKYTTDKNGGLR